MTQKKQMRIIFQLGSCLYLFSILHPLKCHADSLTAKVLDATGHGIEGVAVYLHSSTTRNLSVDNIEAIDISQSDKAFSPYLSIIRAGTEVTFSNSDDITHHIYSISRDQRFSYTLRAGEMTSGMPISQPGTVGMGCNLHDWMTGYLLVVDTPYYGITGSDGKVTFEDIPEDYYQVFGWHPQIHEELIDTLTFPNDKSVTLKLTMNMRPIPKQKSTDDFDFLEDY